MNEARQLPEKRLTKRVLPAQDQPIEVVIKLKDCTETTHATNISRHGMGIVLADEFQGCDINGSAYIDVKLPQPVNHSFSARVKIVHQQGNQFGIRFEIITSVDEEILSRYIDHRLVNTDGASVMKALYGI